MNNNKVEGYSRKKKITQICIHGQQKAFLQYKFTLKTSESCYKKQFQTERKNALWSESRKYFNFY